jgi:hypothetical protein
MPSCFKNLIPFSPARLIYQIVICFSWENLIHSGLRLSQISFQIRRTFLLEKLLSKKNLTLTELRYLLA